MDESPSQRRLAAIMMADAVGYSRLMGEDDAGTVAEISAARLIFAESVSRFGGRVVNTPGDSILAEFGSAIDAVSAAREIQHTISEHNAALPASRRMPFRIGINLGDVIVQEDAVYGDGVNIAARLESLAEPGGICIARNVYDQVKARVPAAYDYLGEHHVKNIAEPVRVYRLRGEEAPRSQTSSSDDNGQRLAGSTARLAGIVALVLIFGAVMGFWWLGDRGDIPMGTVRPGSDASLLGERLPIPDRPSVAVLPLDNLTGDTDKEFFCDGLSESIITTLSKIPELFVIARNSSFQYKNRSVDIRTVGQELGVRYVLEGSVQAADERIRMNVQLIDAQSGRHVWAEQYDRDGSDLFEVQDHITQNIALELQVHLTRGEHVRVWRHQTSSVRAWELVARSLALIQQFNARDNLKARDMLTRAIELDAEYALGWVMLGWTYSIGAAYAFEADPEIAFRKGVEFAQRALEIDPGHSDAHTLLGWTISYVTEDWDKALYELELAAQLDPNNALTRAILAERYNFVGRPQDALREITRAIRLSPYEDTFYPETLGEAYRLLGRYEEAIEALALAHKRAPDSGWTFSYLVAALWQAGRREEAREVGANFLRANPEFRSAEFVERAFNYADPAVPATILVALQDSGLP